MLCQILSASHLKTSPQRCLRPITLFARQAPARPIIFNLSPLTLQTRRFARTHIKPAEPYLAQPQVQYELRPYQAECIDTCLMLYSEGHKRQVVSLPVGSGKTVIFANMIPKILPPLPTATKTLVIAHREELLEQARRQILRVNPGLNVEIDMGKRHAKLEGDVIVASVPSLGRKGATRLEKYDQRYFKCIIIDEAHHAAAESYRRIINHFGAADPDSHIFVWGCSATVRRHDGLRLSGVFDYVAYYQDFMPMIEQGWLCKMKVTTIETKIDISDVKLNQFLDFKEADLSRRINTTERNDIVVRSHLKFAEGRCSTLVFAVDITHTMELCNTFRRYGVNARFITSETHQVERQETLQMFRDRAYPVLVNCGILTEGTDIPNIDCVLLARPTKSTTLFQQMLGRGMRLHPGKDNCLMLDFVDNFKRAGEQGLMSIPTLLGLDPKDLMEDADVLEANKKAEQRKSVLKVNEDEELDEEPDTTRKIARLTVTEYDNPYDIIDDCSGSPQLMKISQLSWLSVGGGVYVLQLKDGTVRVEQEEDGIYRAKHRKTSKFQDTSDSADKRTKPAFRKIQHPPVYLHLSGDDLPSAIRAVDTWVKTTYSHTGIQHLSRYAKFRKEPATEPQIRLLKKHLIGDTFDPSRLTKGQAMNILGRLFEGAGKKWRVEEEKKKKEEKRWSQERKWKEQMKEIMVGPIRKMEDV